MAGSATPIKLHGKNGAIYIGGGKPGGSFGTGVKMTAKTEWSLQLNRDYVDSTTFGAVNKTYLVGLKDIQGSFAGLLDLSGDDQVNTANSDAVQIYLYADDRAGFEILVGYGPGLIDAAITASNTDAIKTTGNFRAADAWRVFTTGVAGGAGTFQ